MVHLTHYALKHSSILLGISAYLVSNLPIQAHCLLQKVSFITFLIKNVSDAFLQGRCTDGQ